MVHFHQPLPKEGFDGAGDGRYDEYNKVDDRRQQVCKMLCNSNIQFYHRRMLKAGLKEGIQSRVGGIYENSKYPEHKYPQTGSTGNT